MYEQLASWYDDIYRAAGKDYAAEAAQVIDLVEARNPSARTLLDVACGTAAHLEHLRERFDVTGVDGSKAMLARARKRLPGVRLERADMRDMDLGRRFDAVTCLFSSVGHLASPAELDTAVARMAAHLVPGGVLVVEGWVRRTHGVTATWACLPAKNQAAHSPGCTPVGGTVHSCE